MSGIELRIHVIDAVWLPDKVASTSARFVQLANGILLGR